MLNKKELLNKIESLRKEHNVPSVQIAICIENEIVLSEGFGFRDVENQIKADSNTLYAIGSVTKSFTAAALALLVDEKKIEWDEPVKKYIPEFEMYDTYVTENLTIRDICSHRCGLPRHDFMWLCNDDLSLEDIILKLKYLEPSEPFRYTFQYQNHMYALAGYLIERVTGQKWNEFIKEKITMPLCMKNTSFNLMGLIENKNVALPYILEEEIRQINYKNIDNVGPAGSINSNVEDMIKWIIFNLNKGDLNNEQIISIENLTECYTPQMIIKQMFPWKSKEELQMMYGMGWVIEPYRGYKVIHHSGGIDGFSSMASFIPEKNAGFIILTNSGNTNVPKIIQYMLYDMILGFDQIDWNSKITYFYKKQEELANQVKAKLKNDAIKNTKPSFEMWSYEGKYVHLAYEKVEIKCLNNSLKFKYGNFDGKIEHICFDTFMVEGKNNSFFPIQFKTNTFGRIESVEVELEPSLNKPIIFKKI